MNQKTFIKLIVFLLLFFFEGKIHSQPWDFIKEKDSIKIYTRNEPNTSLKSVKGTIDMHTSEEKLLPLICNIKNFALWDENIRNTKILYQDRCKWSYSLVYHLPWPLTDRNLCLESKMTTDPNTGMKIILTQSISVCMDMDPSLVRITKYCQKCTLEPLKGGIIRLTLEVFMDPAGNVPAWLYDRVITDTPLNLIRKIKKLTESKK